MTDSQMSSEIQWHSLDDSTPSSYPKKVGELYLVRIYRSSSKDHYYGIARLWRCEDYKKRHPAYNGFPKYRYVFVSDENDSPLGRKAGHSDYVDGWCDLLFAAASQQASKSQSSSNSKIWLDLRNKHK